MGILLAAWVTSLFLQGEYTLYPWRPWPIQAFLVAKALAIGTVSAAGVAAVMPRVPVLTPSFYLLSTAAMLPLVLAARLVALRVLPRHLINHRYLVLTDGAATQAFWKSLTLKDLPRYVEIVGTVPVNGAGKSGRLGELPQIGEIDELPQLVESNSIHTIILGGPADLPGEQVRRIMECEERGVRVVSALTAHEEITHRTPLAILNGAGEKSLETAQGNKYATRLKRVLDVVITLALMPLALPLMGLAALAVVITDGWPALYRQERVGKDHRPFSVLKIRTMIHDAEAQTGPVWAQKDDPRVTAVGRLLRATRLDELPQLFNVLRGDMSLVGPRPERPAFVEQFVQKIPFYEQRLLVRPGLTGWAQVNHNYDRNEADVYEKLRYDLYYLRHLSFALDLQILLDTLGVVCKRSGAQ
jgi:exopolysaccharide biosynthesis polyprenyl glycosylphosphotransferase